MLAERLHEFAKALKADYAKTDIVSLLGKLASSLRAQASSPTTAQYQTAVSEARTAVEKALRASDTRKFPPSWRHLLRETNLEPYVGDGVLERLTRIFSRNALLLSEASSEVDKLSTSVSESADLIEGLINGLEWCEIDSSFLKPGTFEIDITIPRPAIDNELGELGSEFVKLDRIIGFFNEITTGSRDGAKLIAIGSSDPTAFLEAWPATAAAFAVAIERVVAFYGKILEIRKSYSDLKKSGVPDTALEGLRLHVENAVKEGLEHQAKEFEERYLEHIKNERRPELNTELRYVLGQLAERVDDGYRFDVRGRAAAKDDPNTEEVRAALEVVQRHRPSLLNFENDGTPILRLSDRRTSEK